MLGIPRQLIDLQLTNILLLITPYKSILDFDWLIDCVFHVFRMNSVQFYHRRGIGRRISLFKTLRPGICQNVFPPHEPQSFRLFPILRHVTCFSDDIIK